MKKRVALVIIVVALFFGLAKCELKVAHKYDETFTSEGDSSLPYEAGESKASQLQELAPIRVRLSYALRERLWEVQGKVRPGYYFPGDGTVFLVTDGWFLDAVPITRVKPVSHPHPEDGTNSMKDKKDIFYHPFYPEVYEFVQPEKSKEVLFYHRRDHASEPVLIARLPGELLWGTQWFWGYYEGEPVFCWSRGCLKGDGTVLIRWRAIGNEVVAVSMEPELRIAFTRLDHLFIQSLGKTILTKPIGYSTLTSDVWNARVFYQAREGSTLLPEFRQLDLKTLREETAPFSAKKRRLSEGKWIPVYAYDFLERPRAYVYFPQYDFGVKYPILFEPDKTGGVVLPSLCNGYEGDLGMREPWYLVVCEKSTKGGPVPVIYEESVLGTDSAKMIQKPRTVGLNLKITRSQRMPLWRMDRNKDGFPEWVISDRENQVWLWDSREKTGRSLGYLRDNERLQGAGALNGKIFLAIAEIDKPEWRLLLRNADSGKETSFPFGAVGFLSTREGDFVGIGGENPLVLDSELNAILGDPQTPRSARPYQFGYVMPLNCPSTGLVGFIFSDAGVDRRGVSTFFDLLDRKLKGTWLPPTTRCADDRSVWIMPYWDEIFVPLYFLSSAESPPPKSLGLRVDNRGFLIEAFQPSPMSSITRFVPLSNHSWLLARASQGDNRGHSETDVWVGHPAEPAQQKGLSIADAEIVDEAVLPDGGLLLLARKVLDGSLTAVILSRDEILSLNEEKAS